MKFDLRTMLVSTFYTISSLILTLVLTWYALSALGFSYGVWHDHGGIKEAIDKYGPQNYYKRGFGHTTRDERIRVFDEIAWSVQNHGEGLEEIRYKAPQFPEETLLRELEVTHLQDVANLIDVSLLIGYAGIAIWLFIVLYYYHQNIRPPSFRNQMLTMLAIAVSTTVIVFAIGPVKVFAWMHHVVFPSAEGHEWFFYYQHSLMSTLMLAPVLFGWIAMQWAAMIILWFVPQQYATLKFLAKMQAKRRALEKR